MRKKKQNPTLGVILSGGGARAAYQVGVLKAIAELLPRDAPSPFRVICGTSAGAINSAALAIYGARYHEAVQRMQRVWRNFHVYKVFRSDFRSILSNGFHWLLAFVLGGLGKRNPVSLLDRTPLRRLLLRYLPCERIQEAIDQGWLDAIGITASGYTSGESVTFYQGKDTLPPWRRARRVGAKANITVNHLMASSAIPIIFEAKHINREYFGDGSMRQIAPISPALHLGADRILVIGVTHDKNEERIQTDVSEYPTLAQIAGHILNSIFLDSLEADLERLTRINKTISVIPTHKLEEGGVKLRPIDVLVINPSRDLQEIADDYVHHLPWTIRFLLRGVGAFNRGGTSLVSYLLFEKPFCRALISLGYADTMQRREEVAKFLQIGEE